MKEIIEEFEDSLLSESKDNEDGLLVCEIDVFRKFAQQALTRQREEMIEVLEEKLRIVYKNGLIDGKQETNCEEIVVKEALQSLLVDKNNK